MQLLIQEYLRNGGSVDDLATTHNIKARRHKDYNNLILLKYGIDAAFMNPMVRECRGIILDENDNWNVVSRAFDKFGNEGEGYVPEIDWSTARVQEKLDGSLCVLYHYDDAWRVATSGSPDASGNVQRAGVVGEPAFAAETFAEYFWSTFEAQGGTTPSDRHNHLCFAFELTGPLNRVVVVHERPALHLLAVRNRVTGEQYQPFVWSDIVNIDVVASYPLLNSFDALKATFDEMSPVAQEGYVVVDGNFNRVKIKHPGYVALHHAKDGMGPKAFVEIARTGEVGEVLSAFPEFKPLIEDARAKYQGLIGDVRAAYEPIRDIEVQKDFAAQALLTPWSTLMFQMRKGVELEEFLRGVQIEKLMHWMGVA
jgi:hypothetical protein